MACGAAVHFIPYQACSFPVFLFHLTPERSTRFINCLIILFIFSSLCVFSFVLFFPGGGGGVGGWSVSRKRLFFTPLCSIWSGPLLIEQLFCICPSEKCDLHNAGWSVRLVKWCMPSRFQPLAWIIDSVQVLSYFLWLCVGRVLNGQFYFIVSDDMISIDLCSHTLYLPLGVYCVHSVMCVLFVYLFDCLFLRTCPQ